MSSILPKRLAVLLLSALATSAVACAATTDAADADDAEETADELSTAGRKLIGSYQRESGDLRALVLSTEAASASSNRFFAVVRTGIVCVTAPCPTEARVEGTFTATGTYLKLSPKQGGDFATRAAADKLRGKYKYVLVPLGGDAAKLNLTPMAQPGGTVSAINLPGSLEKVTSYCIDNASAANDCQGQGLPQPRCAAPPPGSGGGAGWQCSNEHRCHYSCQISAPVWPANATKLVAENKGGGFTPPPPAGSECNGQSKYTLDVAAKKVSWEVCKRVDWVTPFTKETGTTQLNASQLAKINAAMNGVTLAGHDICGADKPLLQISVTAGGATKTYKDSFYSCMGDGLYVDHIDSVFVAFREVTGN
jgi:hypothetical protein